MVTSLRRDTRIRTWDPLLPKQVRYRAALHPENLIGGLVISVLVETKPLKNHSPNRG